MAKPYYKRPTPSSAFKGPIAPKGVAVLPPGAPGAPTPPDAQDPTASASTDPGHDSGYVAGLAKLTFNRDQALANIGQQQKYDETDFQEALRRAASQHPEDVRRTKEGANREGLFYSGQLDKRLTGSEGVETLHQRQVADRQRDFQRRSASREASKQALQQGFPIDVAALAGQEADRRVLADQTNPPAPDAAPAPGAGTAAAVSAGASGPAKGPLVARTTVKPGTVPAAPRLSPQPRLPVRRTRKRR